MVTHNEFTYKIAAYDSEYTISTIMKGDLSIDDAQSLSEEAAEDFYNNHDGWECDWPIEFKILIGDELSKSIKVELDNCPVFSAY